MADDKPQGEPKQPEDATASNKQTSLQHRSLCSRPVLPSVRGCDCVSQSALQLLLTMARFVITMPDKQEVISAQLQHPDVSVDAAMIIARLELRSHWIEVETVRCGA